MEPTSLAVSRGRKGIESGVCTKERRSHAGPKHLRRCLRTQASEPLPGHHQAQSIRATNALPAVHAVLDDQFAALLDPRAEGAHEAWQVLINAHNIQKL